MADQKKPIWPELKYGESDCKRCRELDKRKFVPKPDDHDYIHGDDDFGGDEELMLRVIHYRRTCNVTSRFDVDCPPSFEYAYIFPREHYDTRSDPDLDKKVEKAVKFAIDTYNQHKDQNLILLSIQNVNIQRGGCAYLIIYATFEGFNDRFNDEKSYVHVYRTVVSFARWRFHNHAIYIFRRSNPTGKDEDLLPPESYHEESTRVKKELMWTLD